MSARHARALAVVLAALGLLALRPHAGPSPARPADEPPRHDVPAASTLRRGEPLDLNAVSADELALLPRLGPALAARIVADRAARGPFRTVDELSRVPGVGPRTVERVRGLLVTRPQLAPTPTGR